jgi:hypothetical protein
MEVLSSVLPPNWHLTKQKKEFGTSVSDQETKHTRDKKTNNFTTEQERPPNHPTTVFSNELEGDSSAYLASFLQISGEERSDESAASPSLSSSLSLYLGTSTSPLLANCVVLVYRSNLCSRREPRSLASQVM